MTIRNAASMGLHGSTWNTRGYCGQGQVAELIGSLAGRSALVCGNAAGVFAEVEAAQRRLDRPVIFAVNDVGMYLPQVDHWVSLHADKLGTWRSVRWAERTQKESTQYHSDTARPFIDWTWQQVTPQFCLSGYFAMQVAWIMGCEHIVLCGCPGDATPRFFEAQARESFGYGSQEHGSDRAVGAQLQYEMARLPEFKQAIRSMSGWTKSYFGTLEEG